MTGTPGERKTVFFHVHKTGGMTFRHLLKTLYPDSFALVRDPRVEAVQPLLRSNACIEFHNIGAVPAHSELVRQNRLDLLEGQHVFTMLREPADHAVSLFEHMLRYRSQTEPVHQQDGHKFPESLEEFAENACHFNTQTAFLAGKTQLGHIVDAGDLAKAKQLLVSLRVHVGLTERFSDSIHIFEQVTGLRIPGGTILNRNRTIARLQAPRVSASLRQRLREQSAFDLDLYDFGRQLFLTELQNYGPAPIYRYMEELASPTPHLAPLPAPNLWTRLKSTLNLRR